MEVGITALGSGSRGNAFVISCDNDALLIDAGFSRRELISRMQAVGIDPESIGAILLTHEHTDHLNGCRVFANAHSIPVCMTWKTAQYLKRKKPKHIAENMVEFEAGNIFDMCGFRISPFTVQHDAVDPVGFVIGRGSLKIGIATDIGSVDLLAKQRLSDCDALLLETNYDMEMLRRSPRSLLLKRRIMGKNGHLHNIDAMTALPELITDRTKVAFMVHLSSECNCPDLVKELVYETLKSAGREDLPFHVVEQNRPIPTVTVKGRVQAGTSAA
jgi:phosphoribosyl 1,2-cyclic phosphodiesterase